MSWLKQPFPTAKGFEEVIIVKGLVTSAVKYRFIEFFVFDYESLPYLLSLFFWWRVTFPLAALDKIYLEFAFYFYAYTHIHQMTPKKKKWLVTLHT